MDQAEQKVFNDIEKYGCHIMHVLAEDNLPEFTYSIGIRKNTGQPELIVMGLPSEVSQFIINEYNDRIKSGEIFQENLEYQGFLEGVGIQFKAVSREFFQEHFGWALWYYQGDDFNVLQAIYPTTSGIWPWDDNAPEGFTEYQPILNSN